MGLAPGEKHVSTSVKEKNHQFQPREYGAVWPGVEPGSPMEVIVDGCPYLRF